MQIRLSPVRFDFKLDVSVVGEVININGQPFDFSLLPDGSTLPAAAIDSEHFGGDVSRIGGELHITLRLPHGSNPPPHVAFPEPITVNEDGPIKLPTDEVLHVD